MTQSLKEIKKIQTSIGYSELLQLFESYQHDPSQPIRDKIFNANLGLVFSICYNYRNQNPDEVHQLGFLGLTQAIQHFDPSKKIRFSTYATRVITNEINNGLNQSNKVIPIPKHLTKKVRAGEVPEIQTTDLENIQLEIELQESDIEQKIDRDLFWLLLKDLCTEDEIDILIKMYCSEKETKLIQVARSINRTKQFTYNKIQRVIKRLKNNEAFKNNIRFT